MFFTIIDVVCKREMKWLENEKKAKVFHKAKTKQRQRNHEFRRDLLKTDWSDWYGFTISWSVGGISSVALRCTVALSNNSWLLELSSVKPVLE